VRTQRELSQLGYFDPEKMGVNPVPNPQNGTVDIEYRVEEKPSDQLQLSGGWGAGRLIGNLGLAFNNFSAKKFFKKGAWAPLPSGDGQRLSVNASSTGRAFQSYNLSFTNFNQIPSNKAIVLVDKLNNSITNLRLTPNYTFTINNSISASFGKRFLLIITDQLNTLPVKLIAFSGNNRGKHNELLWTTNNEKNMVSYDVQRSTDGINFETIGLIKPSNISTTSKSCLWSNVNR
jgi:outer membrane protein assembly factor BamA